MPVAKQRFRKIRQLGRGSLGAVFEAYDEELQRRVVIREFTRQIVDDPQLLRRCKEKYRACTAISHPNVLTVHTFDEGHQCPRAVVEFLDGRTLNDLKRDGSQSPERIALWLGQALEGLHQLHRRDVVLGDLCPDHIFVNRGVIKIGDFGATSINPTATPPPALAPYQAPEVWQPKTEPEKASDLYSLGVVAFELAVGPERFLRLVIDCLQSIEGFDWSFDREEVWRLFHESNLELATLRALDPSIPEPFSRAIARLMAKDPAKRPATCREALQDLASMRGWTQVLDGMAEAKRSTSDEIEDDILALVSPNLVKRVLLGVAIVLCLLVVIKSIGLIDAPGEAVESTLGERRGTDSVSLLGISGTEDMATAFVDSFLGLAVERPATQLRLTSGSSETTIRVGTPLEFSVLPSEDVYGVFFVVSALADVICIYPSPGTPILELRQGVTQIVPREEDVFRGMTLEATGPTGEDLAFLLVSPQRPKLPYLPQEDTWVSVYEFRDSSASDPAVQFLHWVEEVLQGEGAELVYVRYKILPAG